MANKKEPIAQKHKAAITQSALELFTQNGYDKVTMDDVAKHGDYSKRTVYEYFKSKEEIYFSVVLSSFRRLLETVENVCATFFNKPFDYSGKNSQIVLQKLAKETIKQQFFTLCSSLSDLYDENPLAFESVTQFSSLPQVASPHFEILLAIYEIGEQINSVLAAFLSDMIEAGAVKKDLPIIPTIFMLWSSLSGIMKMARAKQVYLVQVADMDCETFMQYSFELLYRSIAQ